MCTSKFGCFLIYHYWKICVHPNLDVSSLPSLEYICAHPNLDVPSLPQLHYVCLHSNSDVSCLPKLEYNFDIKFVCL